jgi:Na+-driven multidrug efflux pump
MTSKYGYVSHNHLISVLRTSWPICSGGVLTYATGITEISIVGYISFNMIAVIGMGQLLISLPMSALMAITSANQAIFAKIDGKILSSKSIQRIAKLNSRKFDFSLASILTSFVIGCMVFLLMSYAVPNLISIMLRTYESDATLRVLNTYISVAKFSLLVVPITMGIKGILNGSNLEAKSLLISTIESMCRLCGLFTVVGISSINHLNGEDLAKYIAGALLIAEIVGFTFALHILRIHVTNPHLSSQRVPWLTRALVAYLHQARSYLTYSSLQNIVGVSANLVFLSLLNAKSPILASQFRMGNSVFNFNRLVFNGFSQANAIVSVREVSAKGFINVRKAIASTTQFLLIASFFISLMLAVATYTMVRQENVMEKLFISIITLSFLVEGLSLIIFRLLLHFGRAKSTAAINMPPLIIFSIIIPLSFDLDPFSFSIAHLAESLIVLIAYVFIYWSFIRKDADIVNL